MLIKLIFSLLIVAGCTMIGTIYASSLGERVKLLSGLQSTLQMLETEIVYGGTPLPLLLPRVAEKSKTEISAILLDATDQLSLKEGATFAEAWRRAVKMNYGKSALHNDDLDILINLGNNLGISDKENQVKHIRLSMEDVRRNFEVALALQQKNSGLYRHLGLLAGISIVIILF